MGNTVGIDIGRRRHTVARCREGHPKADREVLRIGQDRAGTSSARPLTIGLPDPTMAVSADGGEWRCDG